MTNFLSKLFSSKNDRELKRLSKIVQEINELEPHYEGVVDLAGETNKLKQHFTNQNFELDSILPVAFALVREASKRTKGMRHFDEQMLGGIALHEGKIAEMRPGEGKTLVATLPAYLNALSGNGVHVVTVNDYLARRDANWMAPIYQILGMSVGVIQSSQDPQIKREAYHADITYGTNNEFGFDYLRSNMVFDLEERLQRDLNYAIVDEVDSILIDEARTPLIISGKLADAAKTYYQFASIAQRLVRDEHYEVDEEKRTVAPTERGVSAVEKALGIENLYEGVSANPVSYTHLTLPTKRIV